MHALFSHCTPVVEVAAELYHDICVSLVCCPCVTATRSICHKDVTVLHLLVVYLRTLLFIINFKTITYRLQSYTPGVSKLST